MVTLKCLECCKEFEAQRSSAKFCSTKCRVDYNRRSEEEKSVIQPTDIIQEKIEKQVENFVKIPTTEPELKGIIPAKKETTTFQGFVELVNHQTEPQKPEKIVLRKASGIMLGADYLADVPKTTFQKLLIQFNLLVEEQPPVKDIEAVLYDLIEKSSHPDLTPRQSEAIRERCINYLTGQYGKKKQS